MAYFERAKDVFSGTFSPAAMQKRMSAGWLLVSIEWQRELPGDEAPGGDAAHPDIPYGLRVAEDCKRLEIDPVEEEALTLMLELLVQDFSYSDVVNALNERGFRLRNGGLWDRVSVFQMHPRLTEVAPRLYSKEEWKSRRHSVPGPGYAAHHN